MDNNINKNKIFTKHGCLTLEQIMDYNHDRLAMKQRNHVERHMIDCELCSDAVEGYALLEEEKRSGIILQTLNKEIGGSAAGTTWRWMAAAVTAVMILGGGLIYLNNELDQSGEIAVNTGGKDKSKSEKQIFDTIENKNLPKDRSIAIKPGTENKLKERPGEEVLSDGVMESKKEESLPKIEREDIKEEPSVTVSENFPEKVSRPEITTGYSETNKSPVTIRSNTSRLDSVRSVNLNEDEKMLAKEEKGVIKYAPEKSELRKQKIITDKDYIVTKKSSPVKVERKKADRFSEELAPVPSMLDDQGVVVVEEKKEESTPVEKGIDLYNKKQYTEAIKIFEANPSANNPGALYYNGASYLELKNYDKAIENFDKIKSTDSFYEDARWKKALALIGKGEKEKAKLLLQEIIKGNGKYKVNAEEELKKL